MVSAQIPGTMNIYIRSPAGQEKLQYSMSQYAFGPGGSSEGTGPANTPEKWNFLPISADTFGPGYVIILKVVTAGATMDASDSVAQLPLVCNGVPQYVGNSANAAGLGNNNFTVELTWADTTLVASVETPIYSIRAKEGVRGRLGGNRVFISNENNA